MGQLGTQDQFGCQSFHSNLTTARAAAAKAQPHAWHVPGTFWAGVNAGWELPVGLCQPAKDQIRWKRAGLDLNPARDPRHETPLAAKQQMPADTIAADAYGVIMLTVDVAALQLLSLQPFFYCTIKQLSNYCHRNVFIYWHFRYSNELMLPLYPGRKMRV